MKWVYERWTIKWDNSGWESSSGYLAVALVDIATLQASTTTASSTPVGAVVLPTTSDMDAFSSGRPFEVRYKRQNLGDYRDWRKLTNMTMGTLAALRIKDERLEDIVLEEGTVPDDGIHTDGYWYVKLKPAFPTMRILRDGQWAEVETGYVLKDGVWKPIEEIYKLQDGQWVQA